jgi:AcrR family transcriptional regulator
MAARATRIPKDESALDRAIVDAAIARAEVVGWENIALRDVAAGVPLPLADLLARFRDADAIADAWFARGRAAMVAAGVDDESLLPARQRLETSMLRWFDAFAPHRRVTVQMLQTKLWPFHPHHWVPMIFSLSRHVQLWRDVARLEASGGIRAVEEVALTWLFLATLAVWATDGTSQQQRTRAFLRARLADVDSARRTLCGDRRRGTAREPRASA